MDGGRPSLLAVVREEFKKKSQKKRVTTGTKQQEIWGHVLERAESSSTIEAVSVYAHANANYRHAGFCKGIPFTTRNFGNSDFDALFIALNPVVV